MAINATLKADAIGVNRCVNGLFNSVPCLLSKKTAPGPLTVL
jgi:hypothetical protein